MIQMNKNNSFVILYNFWSYILAAFVFLNYIFFRLAVVDNDSIMYSITFIFNYILLILFLLLVFYKFYNAVFNSELSIAVIGISFLILGTLNLYIIEINIHNIIELLFFIITFILTIRLLLPLILSKCILELERGIYIFILLSLLSSNLNYILVSANKIVHNDIFYYISITVSAYMAKLSSFSFLLLMVSYILIFIKEAVMKYINKSFIFVILYVLLSIFSILIFGNSFFLIIVSFFSSLGIIMYLPFTIYIVIMLLFLITLLSSFSVSLLFKIYYPKLIVFTLFILAGLDISNFSLRLISIFAIMEILSINSIKKDDIIYLTNNSL